MTRVQVSEHVLLNVRRRSLCDNCLVVNCLNAKESRVTECVEHKAPFLAFKTCAICGRSYEIFSNLCSLDYDVCPSCNLERLR